uniref:Uncharacterized protein n=1 Tax=Mimivirus LCMiAC02 TaxID=2506609 RepID=A0A481Z2K8_9VIRU|nr:MAG: hypothetical protein LCMiAC02_01070 [Mimivirus LCMiAC02]
MEQSEINKDIFYHVNEIPQAHGASCGILRQALGSVPLRKSHSDCMSAFPKKRDVPRHSASCGIPRQALGRKSHSDFGIQNNTQSNVSINNKNNLSINGAISHNEILDKHETKYNPAIKHGKVFSPNVKEIVAITYKIPISPIISETYKLNNDLLDIHRTLIETKYMYNINKNIGDGTSADGTSASSTLLGGEIKHNTSIFPSTILNTELSYKLLSNYLESISISSYIPNTTVTTEYSDSSDLADSSNITTVTTEKK